MAYASAEDARQGVVETAIRELGKRDPRCYWASVSRHKGPWSVHWDKAFALWCLRTAGLCDWAWRDGSGFLHRLPMTTRPERAGLGDIIHFEHLDRCALIVGLNPLLLVGGAGKAGRVTKTQPTWHSVRYVHTIDQLVERYEPDAKTKP